LQCQRQNNGKKLTLRCDQVSRFGVFAIVTPRFATFVGLIAAERSVHRRAQDPGLQVAVLGLLVVLEQKWALWSPVTAGEAAGAPSRPTRARRRSGTARSD
jgi:hypothetical protein